MTYMNENIVKKNGIMTKFTFAEMMQREILLYIYIYIERERERGREEGRMKTSDRQKNKTLSKVLTPINWLILTACQTHKLYLIPLG